MNKCPYCESSSFRINAREQLECSGCAAPHPDIQKLEPAPLYILKMPTMAVPPEIRARISADWEKQFSGTQFSGRLVVLPHGVELLAVESH